MRDSHIKVVDELVQANGWTTLNLVSVGYSLTSVQVRQSYSLTVRMRVSLAETVGMPIAVKTSAKLVRRAQSTTLLVLHRTI